jgi:hypothetical protein
MAGFRTHITVSSTLGVGYGAAAFSLYNVPLPTCILAGGLCSVSGMLPDLDSDSGVPLRESIAFAASVVPMLMVERFSMLGLSPESMVLFGAGIYLLIRFGLASLLKHYTVHRGMFHSLPAALIAAELAFLLCAQANLAVRYFHAGAVLVGFMSHLLLDEVWSVDLRHVRLKKSFGTAVKFWGESLWANVSAYGKVALLSYMVWKDPVWLNKSTPDDQNLHVIAREAAETLMK